MVLVILFFYFNVYMFSLNRDMDFQDVIARSEQLDADRNAEQVTITNVVMTQSSGQIYITCILVNNGSVPIQMARLWVQDNSLPQHNVVNLALITQPVLLQPGSRVVETCPPFFIEGAQYSDQFYLWFVTFRGNTFSITVN